MRQQVAGEDRSVVLAVLAGGRSSRFGGSKLGVRVDGEPVLAWLARRLGGVCGGGSVLSLGGSAKPQAAGMPPGAEVYQRVVRDAELDAGPLAGVAAVLRAVEAGQIVVVVAADMPGVTAGYVERLVGELRVKPRAAGVMGRWVREGFAKPQAAGAIEPLPSVWRGGAGARLVDEALRRGERALYRLAERDEVACVELRAGDEGLFVNVNRREDLAEAGRVLGVSVEI